jgi:hypothetical protein
MRLRVKGSFQLSGCSAVSLANSGRAHWVEAYQEGNDRHEDRCGLVKHIETNFNLIIPSLPMKLVLPNHIDSLLEGSFPSHKPVCQLGLSGPDQRSLLEHPDTLQYLIHQASTLISSFHDVLLGSHDIFGGEVSEGQTHFLSVRDSTRHVERLTDTGQETPYRRYTEHIVEEQGCTRGELCLRGQREPKLTQ